MAKYSATIVAQELCESLCSTMSLTPKHFREQQLQHQLHLKIKSLHLEDANKNRFTSDSAEVAGWIYPAVRDKEGW